MKDDLNSLYSLSVKELDLSVRLTNCLITANINTVEDILGADISTLFSVKNFGGYCLRELLSCMSRIGFAEWVLSVKETMLNTPYAKHIR